MAKKRSGSSARAARRAKNARPTSDSEIDFSDIPELSDEELSQGHRVGRPKDPHAKQLIAVRLDPRLLAKIRKLAAKKKKPYQTLLQELLEDAMEDAA